MITSSNYNKKASNDVVGGKTARACDNCVKKRARWYCPADDAFLCQTCDHSVHSANSLAQRHERVRLKTASSRAPPPLKLKSDVSPSPTWHRGFTRKARTPRHGNPAAFRGLKLNKNKGSCSTGSSSCGTAPNPFSLVPEFGGDETSHDDNEEQLLYRVPIYDPFVAKLCTSEANEVSKTTSFEANNDVSGTGPGDAEEEVEEENNNNKNTNYLQGFVLSAHDEMDDLAEFAADVESLLGRGLENDECFGMEGLGFVDCKESKDGKETTTESECRLGEGRVVKLEEEEEEGGGGGEAAMGGGLGLVDMTREPFELNFDDYDDQSPVSCGEEDEKVGLGVLPLVEMKNDKGNGVSDVVKKSNKILKMKKKKKILLRLDYEAVITAWGSQGGSPWTTGDRPDFDPDACLPDCMSTSSNAVQLYQNHHHYMNLGGGVGGLINPAILLGDGGREARVSRYREKRQTRLFSKKIRYEVRKLNAEKRPRMKGRFVKRASFIAGLPNTFPKLK